MKKNTLYVHILCDFYFMNCYFKLFNLFSLEIKLALGSWTDATSKLFFESMLAATFTLVYGSMAAATSDLVYGSLPASSRMLIEVVM